MQRVKIVWNKLTTVGATAALRDVLSDAELARLVEKAQGNTHPTFRLSPDLFVEVPPSTWGHGDLLVYLPQRGWLVRRHYVEAWYVDIGVFREIGDGLYGWTDLWLDVVAPEPAVRYHLLDADEFAAALHHGQVSVELAALAMERLACLLDTIKRGAFPPPGVRDAEAFAASPAFLEQRLAPAGPAADPSPVRVTLAHAAADPSPVRVARAQYQDIRSWLDLAAEVEPLFGDMLDDPAFYRALHKHLDHGTAFCAREGNGPPGAPLMGGLLFSPPSPRHAEHRIGWLSVAERWRCHGVGRLLVEHVFGLVPRPAALSVVTFGADVAAGRPARRFYERLGFWPAEPAPSGPEGGSRQVYRRELP